MPAQMQAARHARYVADPANAESQGSREPAGGGSPEPCEGRLGCPACALAAFARKRAVPSRWFPRMGIMRRLWAVRSSIRTNDELLE
jgi:hypothetical protein